MNTFVLLPAASLGAALQTAESYIQLELENTLAIAAVVGIAASISLSFVIVVALTRDFWLSIMAIASIGGVVSKSFTLTN